MKYLILTVVLSAGSLMAAGAENRADKRSSDMRRAIAFERYKDLAAARQARKEARHPSVPAPSSAERSADRQTNPPNQVRDPGPAGAPRK